MKNLLLVLLVLVLFACSKSDSELDPDPKETEVLDPYENYIEFIEVNHPSGAILTDTTMIEGFVKYNVSLYETEGLGLYISYRWAKGSNPQFDDWSWPNTWKKMLNKKNGQWPFQFNGMIYYLDGKPDTIHYKAQIVRKTSDKSGIVVHQSQPITYIVK